MQKSAEMPSAPACRHVPAIVRIVPHAPAVAAHTADESSQFCKGALAAGGANKQLKEGRLQKMREGTGIDLIRSEH
eukprot:6173774-Pleurochrysis_carterae.AAC.3